MLGLSIAFNAVSSHATCTAVYVAVAAIAGIGFGSIRTLGKISWLAWVGLICILLASKISSLLASHHNNIPLTDSYYSLHCHYRCRRSGPSSLGPARGNLGI